MTDRPPLVLTVYPPIPPAPKQGRIGTWQFEQYVLWMDERLKEEAAARAKRLTDAELAAEWYAAQLEVIDAADDGDDVALYVYATRMAKLRRFALHGHYDEEPEGD